MRSPTIQVLRVLAAVTVVGYHFHHYAVERFGVADAAARPFALWGWAVFPVPLFFAISGFVLTQALRTATPGRFLIARAVRLYPGYWLAIGVAILLLSGGRFGNFKAIALRLSATELVLAPAGAGAEPRIYLLGVEWSLFYEVELSLMLGVLSLAGRRALPWLAGVWLAVTVAVTAVAPGLAMEQIPHWKTVLLSPYNGPFLFGVFVFFLRDRGTRYRWPVLIGTAAFVAFAIPRFTSPGAVWCAWGFVGALAVWLAVRFPVVDAGHPLARLGDGTYGLYLVHVPLLLFGFRNAAPWAGSTAVAAAILAATIVVGLAFGGVESRVHSRLRAWVTRPWPREIGSWRPALTFGLIGRVPRSS